MSFTTSIFLEVAWLWFDEHFFRSVWQRQSLLPDQSYVRPGSGGGVLSGCCVTRLRLLPARVAKNLSGDRTIESSARPLTHRHSHEARPQGRTPLYNACEGGHAKIVKTLIVRGTRGVNRRTNFGWTPLLAATFHGQVAFVL